MGEVEATDILLPDDTADTFAPEGEAGEEDDGNDADNDQSHGSTSPAEAEDDPVVSPDTFEAADAGASTHPPRRRNQRPQRPGARRASRPQSDRARRPVRN